ncbi:chorismate synthase [Desulfacinum infernum DSM 9756]|uniref:Chorismate synthase n=1 Tax=Desulfacinum infernum DSM 9756 TaxID=1121391 RepID=A0A1M5CHI9_9BACT|nr:chorismate synthase [Desulfacinum infernum]SHF54166.1 chorismate synthase [Desulfacinum infernum DSM 9756]
MPGNSFGRLFRVMTWGESHGPALGAVIDGCPPGIPLSEEDIQRDLERRRPGKALTTARREPDEVRILSGVFQGMTTGTPISLVIYNKDMRSRDYEAIKDVYRPGHADRTYEQKYGVRDWRGGGRSSGRETVARVAAGAVARKFLAQEGIRVFAGTVALGDVTCRVYDWEAAAENPLFCPDPEAAQAMEAHLQEVRGEGDTLGGIVQVNAVGCPPGLGEPVFDKLDARLASALMSIGAVKGVEIGVGFAAARMRGSENNDPPTADGYASNNAGGVLGGISSGMDLVVRAAVKPIPSIAREQRTVTRDGKETTIRIGGRHDIAAIPRIVPVCEAMVLITLADFMLHPFPRRRSR